MTRKLLISPWFGEPPPWMDMFRRNTARLAEHGFDFLIPTDENDFRCRVHERLGVVAPRLAGTRKVGDFLPALGVIYADKLAGYDFWAHVGLDCVYGRVERFITDRFLECVDIHANEPGQICGPWTMYRNAPLVNGLFADVAGWQMVFADPATHGWDEGGFSRVALAAGHVRVVHTDWQTYTAEGLAELRLDGARLMQGDTEVMMGHFTRTREWPAGCVL